MESNLSAVSSASPNSNLDKKNEIENAPFPYNRPDILAKYRGHNIVVVDDQIVAAGDIDYRPILHHYRKQGKEPVIICVPAH